MRKRDFRYLLNRDLRAGWSCDENAAQLIYVVAEVTQIANIHGIAFAAFYVFGYIHATDPRRDSLLYVGNRQSVLRSFGPVHFEVYVKALGNPLGEYRPDLRVFGKKLLY